MTKITKIINNFQEIEDSSVYYFPSEMELLVMFII